MIAQNLFYFRLMPFNIFVGQLATFIRNIKFNNTTKTQYVEFYCF